MKRAFFHTEEFTLFETLLSQGSGGVSYEEVLALLDEGSVDLFRYHAHEIQKEGTFSEERRRKVLISYVEARSKTAACLLLRSDLQFASERLNDPLTMILLSLSENSPHLEEYALHLLSLPRRSEVWSYAQKTLAQKLKKPGIELLPRKEFLSLFGRQAPSFTKEVLTKVPVQPVTKETKPSEKSKTASQKISTEKPLKKEAQKKSPPPKKVKLVPYTVQRGDNLWKIAKKFQTTVSEIEKANKLTTHDLKPGEQLLIPRQGP